MKKYKVILWDFDGTLAYTCRDVWNSIEYAAEQLGGKVSPEYMSKDSNLSNPLENIYRNVEPYPGEKELKKFDELITLHYRRLSDYTNTVLYEGIEKVLRCNKKNNLKNFIITMKPREALERILVKKRWSYLFDGWLSPDSFGDTMMTKSELISIAIGNFRVKSDEIVYIGDSWSDVRAATENSIDCIGVSYGDGDVDRLMEEKPRYCVDSPSEIEMILKERR